MAKVPVYNVPTASPENISDIRGYVNAQTFGAGVGAAISGIGSKIENAGDMFAANALRLQTLENQADADMAMSSWVIDQGKLDTDFMSLEGKARSEAFPAYIKKSQELRERYANSSKNPEVRRLFNQETRRLAAYSIRNAAQGVATGLKQYNTKANARLLEMARLTTTANPSSDGAFSEAWSTAERAIRQEAENRSDDPETLNYNLTQAKSKLLRERITALANDDPQAAIALYDKHKKEIQPTDRQAVESAVNSGRQKAGTQAAMFSQGIQSAVESDLKSVLETGEFTNLTFEQVRAGLGEVAAKQWEEKRVDASIIWNRTRNLATTPKAVMDTDLAQIAPVPGSKDFARQYERFKIVKKAMEDQLELRKTDPAQSVANDPQVKEILKNFSSEDPEIFPILAQARLAAQARAGIPENERSTATLAESLPLMKPLQAMLPGQEGQVILGVAKTFQERFGPGWERVFTQALFANRYSNEIRQVGAVVVKKLAQGRPIDAISAREIQTANESAATTIALPPQTIDETPYSGPVYQDEFGVLQRVPIPNPAPKVPLSKRILDKLPPERK